MRDLWFHTQFHWVVEQFGAKIWASAELEKSNGVVRAVRIDIWENRRMVGPGENGARSKEELEADCGFIIERRIMITLAA